MLESHVAIRYVKGHQIPKQIIWTNKFHPISLGICNLDHVKYGKIHPMEGLTPSFSADTGTIDFPIFGADNQNVSPKTSPPRFFFFGEKKSVEKPSNLSNLTMGFLISQSHVEKTLTKKSEVNN